MTTSDMQSKIKPFLDRFEKANRDISELRQKHERVFEELDALEEEKKEALESIKKIVHGNKQPPPGLPGKTLKLPGSTFNVEVLYKQAKGYYDPAKLPKSILQLPGVVVEVDSDLVRRHRDSMEALQQVDGAKACDAAWVDGDWQTPSVSIPKIGEQRFVPARGKKG